MLKSNFLSKYAYIESSLVRELQPFLQHRLSPHLLQTSDLEAEHLPCCSVSRLGPDPALICSSHLSVSRAVPSLTGSQFGCSSVKDSDLSSKVDAVGTWSFMDTQEPLILSRFPLVSAAC